MSDRESAVEITGVVRDASGAPVAGAHVLFTDGPVPLPDIAALTDGGGGFSLAAPAPGDYTILCRADPVLGSPGTARATVHVGPPGRGAAAAQVRVELTLG